MTTVTKFFGFGAFVGAVRGLRLVDWWPEDPAKLGWDGSKLISTDLSRSPLGVVDRRISIAQVDVDDHLTNQGLTRIGPRYPQGEMVGAIWLSETFYNGIPAAKRPPRDQNGDGNVYELTSLLYWDGDRPGRRFFGFRGKITGVDGTSIKLDVWHGGRGRVTGEVGKPVQIDSADVDPTHSTITKPGDDGAIYIEDKKARELQLMSPKKPESSGFDFY